MRGPEGDPRGLNMDELGTFSVIVKYCTDVQHM